MERAVELGGSGGEACGLLAWSLLFGQGVLKDTQRAIELAQRGTDMGNMTALARSPSPKPRRARASRGPTDCSDEQPGWQAQAPSRRDPRIGRTCTGRLEQPSLSAHMQQAVQLDSVWALSNIAQFYLYGMVVPEDKAKGLEYFERAASRGDLDALQYLVTCYRWGNHGVVRDPERAQAYHDKWVYLSTL